MSKKAIATALQAGANVLVVGDPGTGKTTWFGALARAMKLPFVPLIGASLEPQDVGGFPEPEAVGHGADAYKRVARLPLEEIDLIIRNASLMLLDEFFCTPQDTQAPFLRILQERRFGLRPIHPGTRIALASNPVEQSAGGGHDLAPPTANRLVHLTWPVDPAEWIEGMTAGFPDPVIDVLPAKWEDGIPGARALVAAFVRVKPSLLSVVPKDEAKAAGAFPSPRTWDMTARLLAACQSIDSTGEVFHELTL